jgi:chemotaxis receptor (MCP) glutamine deamidase CheD
MSDPHREVLVAPDHFEIVADDALLIAQLSSAIAVCIYDAVEEAGALLHLRFIVRSNRPADLTDTTLATELLLLDRCIESLRATAPTARNWQARITAHLPEDPEAQKGCDSMLTLVRHYLTDVEMTVSPTDASAGRTRELKFRPSMGSLMLRDLSLS